MVEKVTSDLGQTQKTMMPVLLFLFFFEAPTHARTSDDASAHSAVCQSVKSLTFLSAPCYARMTKQNTAEMS